MEVSQWLDGKLTINGIRKYHAPPVRPRYSALRSLCHRIAWALAGWGSTAPIAGAVVTSGVFVATGQNKIVQHLEGGVIRAIAVREGDIVEPGQTLLLLDEVAPKAELSRLELRRVRLETMDVRLRAEIQEMRDVRFPMNWSLPRMLSE